MANLAQGEKHTIQQTVSQSAGQVTVAPGEDGNNGSLNNPLPGSAVGDSRRQTPSIPNDASTERAVRSSDPSVAAEVEAAVPRSGGDATSLDGNAVQDHVSARRILHVSISPTVTAPCEKRRAGELDMPERAAKTRRLSMTTSPPLLQAEVTGYPEGNSRAKPQLP